MNEDDKIVYTTDDKVFVRKENEAAAFGPTLHLGYKINPEDGSMVEETIDDYIETKRINL